MPDDPNQTQHLPPRDRDTLPVGSTESDRTIAHPSAFGSQATQSETVTSGGGVARSLPVIPGYEVESELGRGAMGVVYKARHVQLNRVVALKVLLAGEHAGAKELARFRAEAETAAQIVHPNVVQVYDVGEHNGVSYIAAEYANGGDLHAWLGGKPLPVMSAVKLIYTLARAVGAAHKKGIVHRDLKPQNVLLADGVPKVADFGLAKVLGEAGQTTTGAILGTPYYMSPEQASGQAKRVGPAADVYSLGVMLYECLAGRVPFAGPTLLDTLDQVRFAQPLPVQEFRDDIPPALAVIVRRCLSKVPEERYKTADELADDLARTVASGNVEDEAGGFSLPGWLVPLAGILAVLALGWVILNGRGSSDRPGTSPTPELKAPPSLPQFQSP